MYMFVFLRESNTNMFVAAQETFLIIINVENSCAVLINFFFVCVETLIRYFPEHFDDN